ncbi:DNRLRE domain-containing protein [Isoptericola sp. NPDC019693]|uniref:DNRLRE domain-containing protein n=1 Tax=Isoptericola sp. NPDC019693 TaxID=3364009 RepID=UPI00379A888A
MEISASCFGKRIEVGVTRSAVRVRTLGCGLALSLVLVSNLVPASADPVESAGGLAGAQVDCVSEAETVDEAAEVSVACDQETLVAAELTEWSTSYVTASGDLQVDYTATAVRQDSDGDGQWGAVDVAVSDVPTTDVVDGVPAGMHAVTGGVEPIWLNPGGEEGASLPLAVMGGSSERVTMYSQSLPVTGPVTIEDERVSYDLGGGVTMVVTVNAEGSMVTPVVRVEDEAALEYLRNDLLSAGAVAPTALRLSFPLDVSVGLRVAPTEVGFQVRDADGQAVFESGPVQMWDSSADVLNWDKVGPGGGDTAMARAASGDAETGGAPAGEGVAADRLAAPVVGDAVHLMDVSVADDVVTVAPDPQVLADPELEYPLHLDPSIGSSAPARWATVRSRWASSTYWKPSGSQAVGFCDVSRAAECGGDTTDRLFWHFRLLRQGSDGVYLEDLKGSDIKDATFSVYGAHSWDCSARDVDVYGTYELVETVSWNDQPGWRSLQDTQAVSHKADCDNRRYIKFDVTTRVQTAANADVSNISLGMRAGSESSMTWWKRYDSSTAKLSIIFDRPPLPPTSSYTNITGADVPKTTCPTSYAARVIVDTARPILRARGTEPDGTSQVRLRFRVLEHSSGAAIWYSTWTTAASASTSGQRTVTESLQSSKAYRWQVQVSSTDSVTGKALTTEWGDSPTCYFGVDTTYPNPPTVTSSNYPSRQVAGAVGTAIKLSFGANGSSDVEKFEYAYNNTSYKPVAASNGAASVTIPVTRAGLNYVLVRSRDRVNLVSDVTRYEFYVGFPFADGHWQFNDTGWQNGGLTSAANTVAGAKTGPLTLSGGVTWEPSRSPGYGDPVVPNGALHFPATGTGVARAAAAAVDGSESFTVTAVLNADDVSHSSAAVSQEPTPGATTADGNVYSSFHLGLSASADCPTEDVAPCWAFWHVLSEDDGPDNAIARSVIPAVAGQWVRVVGVYRFQDGAKAGDGKNSTLQVFACSLDAWPEDPQASTQVKIADTDPDWKPWTAAGPLRLGSGIDHNGNPKWPFEGAIDEVRVYKGQVIDAADMTRLCSEAPIS